MGSVCGKRLLILGSTELIMQIVLKAKAMGLYTVVTDNKPLSMAPAKSIADKYYDIDLSDTDGIVELINKERIDGVITGFTDSYLTFYKNICQKAGLPCYGSSKAFEIAIDKKEFKKSCQEFGLPVIPGRSVDSLEEAKKQVKELGFPIIMKPADNSGSRGVIKCEREEDIEECYDFSNSFSHNGYVIVERYMSCDNIDLTYYIENGEAVLSATSDRYIYISPQTGSSISSFSVYPSKYTERSILELDGKIRYFIKENGFHDGMLSINSYVDDEAFYLCEMCYRPSGGQHYYLIENQNKIDQLELLINYSINGEIAGEWNKELETPYFEKKCAVLRIIGEPEKRIKHLSGIEDVAELDNVIKVYNYIGEGNTIGKDGTTAQVVAGVWYSGDSLKEIREEALHILKLIHVEDENGKSLVKVYLDE